MPELVHVSPAFHRFLVDRNRDDETLAETLHRLSEDADAGTFPDDSRQSATPPDRSADSESSRRSG